MLSAVAARKAARQDLTKVPAEVASVSTPSESIASTGPSKPEDIEVDEDDSYIPDISVPIRAVVGEGTLLSTFKLKLDESFFALSSAETEFMGLSTLSGNLAIVLVMKPGDALCLLGTYTFAVASGSVAVAGVTLTPSTKMHHVFAPRCAPVPILQCLQWNGKTGGRTSTPLPDRLQPVVKTGCAVVVLQELRTGVEGLGRVCRTFDGVFEPSRWHRSEAAPELGLTGVRVITRPHKDVQPFVLLPSWDEALSDICPPEQEVTSLVPICLVKGPKKAGKSTFARTLLNRLSTRYRQVAFLECDLGQSEFTPGGMVALNVIHQPLFGPPFTHPIIPSFAHYIGSTTPRASPSHYLSAIQALVQSYRLDIQSSMVDFENEDTEDHRITDVVPLVVNTMGWTKGLGADLTYQIECMVEPTDVFEIEPPASERVWPAEPTLPQVDSFMQPNTRHHVLQPISTLNNYSSVDHRILSILSYFHAVFPLNRQTNFYEIPASSWDTELPLCAQAPYEVNWTQALDKVFLTGAGTEDVVQSEVNRVLNGAVVGLVSCEPGAIDMDIELNQSSSTTTYTQGAIPVSPSTSNCPGLAVIRAVSPNSTHIHALTPLPPRFLVKCRILVKGELELPVWGMLDFRLDGGDSGGVVAGVERSKVPYLQWGKGEGIGADRRRVRRNLMRKGQM